MTLATTARRARRSVNWWTSGDILGPFRAFFGAVIVVAGPWLVSIVALGLVTIFMEPLLGRAAVEDLRLTVVYAFCLAPMIAGPIGMVAARMVASDGQVRPGCAPFGVHLAASALSGGLALLFGGLLCFALGIFPFGLGAAFVFLCVAASQLWISFAILTALRAHGVLVTAFLAGMTVSLVCVLLTAPGRPSTEMLVWIFSAGILLCCCLSGMRIEREDETRSFDVLSQTINLLREMRRHRELALGVLFAVGAVWIDKWILWFGPDGARSAAGFYHYAPYDSVMFVAHMTGVPAFAALFLFHDGALAQSMSQFRRHLADGSTHHFLKRSVAEMAQTIWGGLFTILFFQAAFTGCAVLMAPVLTSMIDLSFEQMLVLRTGLMAVFFYEVFFLNCAVLLLANRVRLYFLLQVGLLILNGTLSLVFYAFSGPGAAGFFVAALIAAAATFVIAYRTSLRIDYLVMVGENEALFTKR